jgi:hypothetical protein
MTAVLLEAPFSVEYGKTSASFKSLSVLNTPVFLQGADNKLGQFLSQDI